MSYHLYARVKGQTHTALVGSSALAAMLIFCAASQAMRGVILGIDRATGYDTISLWAAYIAFALALPFIFARFKNSHADRLVGELSYPLYLIHGLVIGIVFNVLRVRHGTMAEIAAIAASVLAAAFRYAVVDRPVEIWRRRKYSAILAPA